MLEQPFSPKKRINAEGHFSYELYDVKEPFSEPNQCEIVIDYVIGFVKHQFKATLLNGKRGDMALVSLLVKNQVVELQGDLGLGLVYFYASTQAANPVAEQIASSLEGKYVAV